MPRLTLCDRIGLRLCVPRLPWDAFLPCLTHNVAGNFLLRKSERKKREARSPASLAFVLCEVSRVFVIWYRPTSASRLPALTGSSAYGVITPFPRAKAAQHNEGQYACQAGMQSACHNYRANFFSIRLDRAKIGC